MSLFDPMTAKDVKFAMELCGVTHISVGSCSLCGYPLQYIRDGDRFFFDPGCDCTGQRGWEPHAWQDLADWINLQTDPRWQRKTRALVGLASTGGEEDHGTP